MKVIIIGANGYIGRNLCHFLMEEGHNLHCCDIQDSYYRKGVSYQSLNITRRESFQTLDFQADWIFFLAGYTGTGNGFREYEKYLDINEKGLLNFLDALKESASKARVIFPSTRLVYRGKRGGLLKEEDPKEAKTLYAANKLACESYLEMYRNVFAIPYTVFRICIPYGRLCRGGESYGTIGFFFQKARAGEAITLYGEGNQRRSFTHVEDLCSSMIRLLEKTGRESGIYNIGGEDYSLRELARAVADKYSVEVTSIAWPEMAEKIESGDTVFDASALEEIIGPAQRHSLMEWIKEN